MNISQCIRLTLMLCALVTISACSLLAVPALVTPNFETETIKLRKGEYQVDPAHSSLLFKIGHLNLATYVGRFNRFDASLEFDPEDIESAALQGIVYLDSIDSNNAEVDELLMNDRWFNTAQFPQASFVSTEVLPKPLDDGRIELQISGDLTIRGITRPVSLTGFFNGGADNLLTRKYTLGFTASGRFKRSDYGMNQFTGLVSDEVTLEFFAEFQRQ